VKFVLATLNRDKVRELIELLGGPDLELVALGDLPGAEAPHESGDTLDENARIKARAAVALTGLPAIADDTGLEVEALGGRPGVHAARYAGPQASYADNVRKLLAELEGVPPARRGARFRTVCAACWPDGVEIAAHGVLEGRIALSPRGAHGFGYDPVFEVEGGSRTLAELEAAEKNARSHRARAARALARLLPLHELPV
jgi:XTP/dITP diphosphohydrolase